MGDFTIASGVHEIVVHYRSATSDYQFWLDDVLKFTFDTAVAPHDLLFTQLRGGLASSSDDCYNDYVVGVIPEPSTGTLLGLAGLALLGRFRRER